MKYIIIIIVERKFWFNSGWREEKKEIKFYDGGERGEKNSL